VMDKKSGFFIDPEKVRYADYEGRYRARAMTSFMISLVPP
jgi:hypothetical protein